MKKERGREKRRRVKIRDRITVFEIKKRKFFCSNKWDNEKKGKEKKGTEESENSGHGYSVIQSWQEKTEQKKKK